MRRDFEGGVYWDEYAETCGEISKKYGILVKVHVVHALIIGS